MNYILSELPDAHTAVSEQELARWFDGNIYNTEKARMDTIRDMVRFLQAHRDDTDVLCTFCEKFSLPAERGRELLLRFREDRQRPVFIGLEGLDGSGKTVQCGLLAEALKKAGKRVFLIDFPRYEGPIGREIGTFLSGKDEKVNAKTIDAKSMCLWYAADRWQSLSKVNFRDYDYVIFNRYTLSSAVYQTARQYGQVNVDFMNWVFDLEHGSFGLPAPDAYLFLDTAMAGCAENLRHKGERSYVEGLDLYEQSKNLLTCSGTIYRWCVENYPSVHSVCCSGPDGLLPREEIHSRIWDCLSDIGLI